MISFSFFRDQAEQAGAHDLLPPAIKEMKNLARNTGNGRSHWC